MEYGSTCTICASERKCVKFNNFTRFRALCDIIVRVMFFKKICEARWHAVSIVLFLTFCGETAYLVRFIELNLVKNCKCMHIMHFMNMLFLRGELMRITFNVGKVTVQENIRTIPKKFGKLYISILLNNILITIMRFIHSANGNCLPYFC